MKYYITANFFSVHYFFHVTMMSIPLDIKWTPISLWQRNISTVLKYNLYSILH